MYKVNLNMRSLVMYCVRALPILLPLFCMSCSPMGGNDDNETRLLLEAVSSGRSGIATEEMLLECHIITAEEDAKRFNKTVEEIEKERIRSQTHGSIRLYAKGFPVGHRFSLCAVRQDGSKIKIGKFIANDAGDLITLDEQKLPISNIELVLGGFFKGETISYVLISKDRQAFLGACLMPNPINSKPGAGPQIITKRQSKESSI